MVRVRFPFSCCAGPDSGTGAIRCNTVPVRPGSKRTRTARIIEPKPKPEPELRHRPAPAVAARGHGFPLIARENSKYPKGTPFIPIFLYLKTSNFHLMVNVGLNVFSYLKSPFGFELDNL